MKKFLSIFLAVLMLVVPVITTMVPVYAEDPAQVTIKLGSSTISAGTTTLAVPITVTTTEALMTLSFAPFVVEGTPFTFTGFSAYDSSLDYDTDYSFLDNEMGGFVGLAMKNAAVLTDAAIVTANFSVDPEAVADTYTIDLIDNEDKKAENASYDPLTIAVVPATITVEAGEKTPITILGKDLAVGATGAQVQATVVGDSLVIKPAETITEAVKSVDQASVTVPIDLSEKGIVWDDYQWFEIGLKHNTDTTRFSTRLYVDKGAFNANGAATNIYKHAQGDNTPAGTGELVRVMLDAKSNYPDAVTNTDIKWTQLRLLPYKYGTDMIQLDDYFEVEYITFYAEDPVVKYNVTFWTDAETQYGSSQTLIEGKSVKFPSNPTPAPGFEFKGWALEGTTEPLYTEYTVGTSDLKFVAVWYEPSHFTIKFWNGDQQIGEDSVLERNAAIVFPAAPQAPEGKKFSGWAIKGTTDVINTTGLTAVANVEYEAIFRVVGDLSQGAKAVFTPADLMTAYEAVLGTANNAKSNSPIIKIDDDGKSYFRWTPTNEPPQGGAYCFGFPTAIPAADAQYMVINYRTNTEPDAGVEAMDNTFRIRTYANTSTSFGDGYIWENYTTYIDAPADANGVKTGSIMLDMTTNTADVQYARFIIFVGKKCHSLNNEGAYLDIESIAFFSNIDDANAFSYNTYFEDNAEEVVFQTEGGVSSVKVMAGNLVVMPEVTDIPEGKVFAGWVPSTDPNAEPIEAGERVAITAGVTYVPKFTTLGGEEDDDLLNQPDHFDTFISILKMITTKKASAEVSVPTGPAPITILGKDLVLGTVGAQMKTEVVGNSLKITPAEAAVAASQEAITVAVNLTANDILWDEYQWYEIGLKHNTASTRFSNRIYVTEKVYNASLNANNIYKHAQGDKLPANSGELVELQLDAVTNSAAEITVKDVKWTELRLLPYVYSVESKGTVGDTMSLEDYFEIEYITFYADALYGETN